MFSKVAEPLYRWALKRRLQRGREDPTRYREKLGFTRTAKPDGVVVWMHGVGLGEVLALRSLINALQRQRNDLHFLVTSSTRTSAEVFAVNQPAHTIHQFLPVDAQGPIQRFLDHWHPALSVWAEQDLWPALVYHSHQRRIPLALVNARMNRASYHSRKRAAGLFKNLYQRFEWISAQDNNTAAHLTQLGASATVGGSLKASATLLADPTDARVEFSGQIKDRRVWLLASSHREDEQLALDAHRLLLAHEPDALLIIAPRFIDRKNDILEHAREQGFTVAARSDNTSPANHQVYIADTFGEMGLWYRLCRGTLIGGTNSAIEGHNPWEAAALQCALMHGPNTGNFTTDYQSLAEHNAATRVCHCDDILAALLDDTLQQTRADNAYQLAMQNNHHVDQLATQLLHLLETRHGS